MFIRTITLWHMIARHVDVGSVCLDICQSLKMDVLVAVISRICFCCWQI